MKSSISDKIFAVIGILMALQSAFLSLTIFSALLTGYTPKYPIFHVWIEGLLTAAVAMFGLIGNIAFFRMKHFLIFCLIFIIADLAVSLHSMYTFSLMSSSPPTLGTHTLFRWIFGISYIAIIWKAHKTKANYNDEKS